MIPERFRERYGAIVDDPAAFFACLTTFPPKSFRVNGLKARRENVVERFGQYGMGLRSVPWYEDAFISDSLEIGSTLEHFLGHIYIQELTSMLPPLLVRDRLPNARLVLDGCAAPGSKTSEIAALMGNRGAIYANDPDYSRIRALKFNLEKTGVLNTVITNMDLRNYPNMRFNVVFIDAPCSSEGICRKNDSILSSWSEHFIHRHSKLQKQLITKGFDLVAPGGVLVYSTCTYAPEENEEVLDWLLSNREEAKIEYISLSGFKTSPGITCWGDREFAPAVARAARIWPHHNDTDGFFMAKVVK